jgi:hypothetical protein
MSFAKSKPRDVPSGSDGRFYEPHVMALDNVLISSIVFPTTLSYSFPDHQPRQNVRLSRGF